GPTWPNRDYLHAATSCGVMTNAKMAIASEPDSPNEARTIWHELDHKCISAISYCVDVPWNLGGFGFNFRVQSNAIWESPSSGGNGESNSNRSTASFEQACREGTLPTVSIIDPGFSLTPCDDHPPHDIAAGQAFIATIYRMLTSNLEQWSRTLFIICYD